MLIGIQDLWYEDVGCIVAKCPTSMGLPQVQGGKKFAPGSGNEKTWRP
jgi:hypothetical protein